MKIVILGTSNSIMGEKGYIKALRQRHEVINLSAGRVGLAFHFNRLLEHYQMIEAADLLIVDHYINDIKNFGARLGAQYIADIGTFYDMLRCLNTHVVNLLFPFWPHPSITTRFHEVAANGTRDRNLCLVDLNDIAFEREHLGDEIHLTLESSYFMGLILAREIARFENLPKPSGGAVHVTPFQRYSMTDLAPDAARAQQANRLMTFDYVTLNDEIALPFTDHESIYGIGYFTPKDRTTHQGISIGPERIALACEPACYFHENLEYVSQGPKRIAPIIGDEIDLATQMGRGRCKGTYAAPFLVDITTRRHDLEFSGTPSYGPTLDVDMSGLLDALTHSVPGRIKPGMVDKIRDLAVAAESRDLETAQTLMRVAAAARPGGPVIQQKLRDYDKRLAAKNGR